MSDDKHFFKPNRVYWWKGYYIGVRNSWSHTVEKKHLSPKEKDAFKKEFGLRIISDKQFDEWIAHELQRKKDH